MNTKDTGGPAFPHEFKYGDGTAGRAEGMTLRDYFAAKAMQMFVEDLDPIQAADMAFQYADAMLKARKS